MSIPKDSLPPAAPEGTLATFPKMVLDYLLASLVCPVAVAQPGYIPWTGIFGIVESPCEEIQSSSLFRATAPPKPRGLSLLASVGLPPTGC